jgi:hypothetical protein
MLLKECIETFQASLGGGVFTSENVTDVKFMEQVLRMTRAACVKELYPNQNNVHEIYYQHVYLDYEEDLQEDECYTVFRYPVILNINKQVDGHQYIGQSKGDQSWVRIKSHAHWANFQKARPGRIVDNRTYYVLEPQYGLVKVFKNKGTIKRAVGYSIFDDPLNDMVPFNRQEDQYPITPECLSLVERYLREGTFLKYLQRPANMVANGADDVTAVTMAAQQAG